MMKNFLDYLKDYELLKRKEVVDQLLETDPSVSGLLLS
jgi:hypothetical protein